MSKQISCNDVVAGCAFTATAETEDEVLARTADHARIHHGMQEIPPELAAKVKSAIKDR